MTEIGRKLSGAPPSPLGIKLIVPLARASGQTLVRSVRLYIATNWGKKCRGNFCSSLVFHRSKPGAAPGLASEMVLMSPSAVIGLMCICLGNWCELSKYLQKVVQIWRVLVVMHPHSSSAIWFAVFSSASLFFVGQFSGIAAGLCGFLMSWYALCASSVQATGKCTGSPLSGIIPKSTMKALAMSLAMMMSILLPVLSAWA